MVELPGRWKDLETILNRSSNLAGPDFEPGEHLLDFLQVRVQHGCIGIGSVLDAIQKCLPPCSDQLMRGTRTSITKHGC